MADFVLSLGAVGFQEFEIPASLKAGVTQAMAVRRYAGGQRTIDAMGPDDKPLQWSGCFLGGDAQQRQQQLDAMARQGVPVTCTWAGYSFLVLIKDFDWNFKRYWEIDYSIALEVIQNQTQPGQQASPNAESQMQSDLGGAATSAGALPSAPPTA